MSVPVVPLNPFVYNPRSPIPLPLTKPEAAKLAEKCYQTMHEIGKVLENDNPETDIKVRRAVLDTLKKLDVKIGDAPSFFSPPAIEWILYFIDPNTFSPDVQFFLLKGKGSTPFARS